MGSRWGFRTSPANCPGHLDLAPTSRTTIQTKGLPGVRALEMSHETCVEVHLTEKDILGEGTISAKTVVRTWSLVMELEGDGGTGEESGGQK